MVVWHVYLIPVNVMVCLTVIWERMRRFMHAAVGASRIHISSTYMYITFIFKCVKIWDNLTMSWCQDFLLILTSEF